MNRCAISAISETDSEADRESMYRWLREFNEARGAAFTDRGTALPLFLIAKDDGGNALGGLEAETQLDWLKVHLMAVAPEHRGNGIGSALLKEAESIALVRGCKRVFVDTMAFQAPEFYAANGYEQVGRLPNWNSHGDDKFFFVKHLKF